MFHERPTRRAECAPIHHSNEYVISGQSQAVCIVSDTDCNENCKSTKLRYDASDSAVSRIYDYLYSKLPHSEVNCPTGINASACGADSCFFFLILTSEKFQS